MSSDEQVISDLLKDRRSGLIVAPMLRTFLAEARFPDDFTIRFTKGDNRRDIDGWFWPSTHPTWPERMLWLYLNDPDSLPEDYRLFMNTLALTMGTAVHGFVEVCLEAMGLRTKELNTCTTCPPERGCTEPGFADEETGTRGHMDGVLDLSGLKPLPPRVPEIAGFEFKTASERVINGIEDLDVDTYRRKKPEYYAQNQEYMRISGNTMIIVVFMQLGWPWTMKEVHVPYDEVYARQMEGKYLSVRQATEMPECCGRKSCALSDWCKVDRATKGDNYYLVPAPPRRN